MPVLTVVKVLLAMYVYGIEGVCVWVEVLLRTPSFDTHLQSSACHLLVSNLIIHSLTSTHKPTVWDFVDMHVRIMYVHTNTCVCVWS